MFVCVLFLPSLSLSLSLCVCVCAQESDIDDNGHVGSMVYVHWLMESVEGAALDRLKTLEVEYKEECFVGQRIQCFVETVAETDEATTEINHHVQTEDGTVLMRAKSFWKK